MEVHRRIGAYGVCGDDEGRVLLVRGSARSVRPGTWFLPGGGVEHGEHPAAAMVREAAEETGLVVEITGLRSVAAEVVARQPGLEHTDGIIYDLKVTGGALQPEHEGTSDAAVWLLPAEAAQLPLSRFAAQALDLPPPAEPSAPPAGPGPPPRSRARRRQRFGVYGLVTDPDRRVLLTLISDGYPGAGRWHLPGGGTDFGEQPADALLREVAEESSQVGWVGELLTVTHHHHPAAVGPEGYPMDWHAVRAVFAMVVPAPAPPRVRDTGGSTAQARWLTRAQTLELPLTELTEAVLAAGEH